MGERIFLEKMRFLGIIFVALLSAAIGTQALAADSKPAKPAPQVLWSKVSPPDQKVLSPLAKDWNQLSGTQQRRLITTAKQYPKLAPIQQERFQDRIKDWAALTPEQRMAAREKFQNLSKLPPAKQHELREKWSEKKSSVAPEPGPSATSEQPGNAR
jgi:hypothetical protein